MGTKMKLLVLASLFVFFGVTSAKVCGAGNHGVECPTGGRCCMPPNKCSNGDTCSAGGGGGGGDSGCDADCNLYNGQFCCGNVCCENRVGAKCCQENGKYKCHCKDKDIDEEY